MSPESVRGLLLLTLLAAGAPASAQSFVTEPGLDRVGTPAPSVFDGGLVDAFAAEPFRDGGPPPVVIERVDGIESLPAEVSTPVPQVTDFDTYLAPGGLSNTLKVMALLTVLSLAPSVLIMTTSFIRFVVVLGLLRQALGTQQLPPNQVLVSLALFLTLAVMSPVWTRAYEVGVRPYTDPAPGEEIGLEEAFTRTAAPLRRFMADQIEATGNGDAVWLFLEAARPSGDADLPTPSTYDDVPLTALLPAYMLSELKTAFVIGFQVYVPFVVIDMVVASVLVSMGMMMLPPVLISLPFKLLLFVLVDGWALTVGMLIDGIARGVL
ncbi:MAG: flagellar type III secretion system pore protein FliP [Planctomycetota bacterium]